MAWRSRWFKWSQFFFWVYSVYYTPWPGCNNYTVIQMDFGCMRHSGCAEFDAQRPLRGCITQSEGSHLGSFPRESVAGRWQLCTKFAYFSNWNWRPHGCESLGDSKWKKLKKTSNSHTLNDDSVHILNRLAVLKVLSCSELAQCVLRQRMNHEKRTNQKSQANQTNQKHRTNRLNETA